MARTSRAAACPARGIVGKQPRGWTIQPWTLGCVIRRPKEVLRAYTAGVSSTRSLGRYIAAVKLLHAYGIDPAPFIVEATRPNGSMNMLRLENLAQAAGRNKIEAHRIRIES
jgi:hypothetical protein